MSSVSVLDRTFIALADPHRRDILDRVSRRPSTTTELATPLGITLTGVLKHVRTLEEAHLVTTYKIGRTRWCRLTPDGLDAAATWLGSRRRIWEQRLDRFEAHLHAQDAEQP
jgi:DNA-binding transcriptional ArsR family regulator